MHLTRLIRVALLLAPAMLPLSAAEEPAPRQGGLTSLFVAGINPQEVVNEVRFSDAPLDAVLPFLQYLTGRVILRPQSLPASQITVDAQNLTRAEALFAVETLLSLNQVGLVPSGARFLKVVPISTIRTEAPELVTTSLANDPPSGKVVSKLFRLEYLDSSSFQAQISPLLSGFASVVPFQNSNMVMVTDTVANLQRLEYVVQQVDRQLEIATKFYEIQFAAADELANQIRTMIESARTGLMMGGDRGARVAGAGAREAAAEATPGEVAAQPAGIATGGVPLQVVVSSSTAISADKRTNQIIVITNPGNLVFFDDLIAKLDVPADPPTAIEVFYMKHADAVEMGSLLSQFVSGRSGATGADRQPRGRERTGPFPGLNAEIRDLSRPASERAQAVQQTVESVIEAQGSQFSELMTIVPDERTNALVISGTNNDLLLIRNVVDRLDIILAQVLIEAVIVEVTLTDGLLRGLDAFSFSVRPSTGDWAIGSITGGLGNIGLTYNDSLITGVFEAAGNDFTNRINVMAVPSIQTTHNREADIIVSTAQPIVTGTRDGDFQPGRFTSFQYQDIGITLTVKPIIGPNDIIQLEVTQKAEDILESVRIGDIEQPTISRREANSYLILEDGEVAVLGGLQRKRDSKEVQKVFLLGDIPLLGELFRNTRTRTERQDLLIFLRPRVIRNTTEGAAAARERIQSLDVTRDQAKALEKITGETVEPIDEGIISDTIRSIRKTR